jgi:hypothetical protein
MEENDMKIILWLVWMGLMFLLLSWFVGLIGLVPFLLICILFSLSGDRR